MVDGDLAIEKAKKEGEKSYRGFRYYLYGKSAHQPGSQASQEVLQLHPALDLLYIGPVRPYVLMLQQRAEVISLCLLVELKQQDDYATTP